MGDFGNHSSLKWQVGLETDIGGGRENQDDGFVWTKAERGIIVLCALDGHGREVGKIAADSAKTCLYNFFDQNYTSLLDSPVSTLVAAHEAAHAHIKLCFWVELEKQGFQMKEADEGYLLKRRPPSEQWTCVHGGTACSIVAIIGTEMYISNVGDSTGTLCSTQPIFHPTDIEYITDAAFTDGRAPPLRHRTEVPIDINSSPLPETVFSAAAVAAAAPAAISSTTGQSGAGAGVAIITAPASPGAEGAVSVGSDTLVFTAEHSPESLYEFERLRMFRSREGDANIPSLIIVYDSGSHDKSKCQPVFKKNAADNFYVANQGSYYKNVRKEWASLVSTPPYARFQDALAFTRSLGDLHLHTYGVTHLPEIQKIDLGPLFARLKQKSSVPADQQLCIVLCSDGVWDNWIYEDVTKFVMDASCLGAVLSSTDGGRRVAMSFMQRNMLFARRNFGAQADNATAIVMYLSMVDGVDAPISEEGIKVPSPPNVTAATENEAY